MHMMVFVAYLQKKLSELYAIGGAEGFLVGISRKRILY